MSSWRQSDWQPSEYELLDFGCGRKLERFGGQVLDRASPAAENAKQSSNCDWSQADLRLDAKGQVIAGERPRTDWKCRFGGLVFNLKLTPFGHLGLFPEQAINWSWLTAVIQRVSAARQSSPRALNLFAYTGGSTMAMAAAGAEVVHVDASAPAIRWGRDNVASSGLHDRPIRWIVDDVRKFVGRELKRGNHYDLIVLDPPSYGHGSGGQRWNIQEHLTPLLEDCARLLNDPPSALLLTAHSPSLLPSSIAEQIHILLPTHDTEHARLSLKTMADKSLDAGFYVRITC